MEFTKEELETIKDALVMGLDANNLNDPDKAVELLDKIDEESDLN